jgi:hypothetical protein
MDSQKVVVKKTSNQGLGVFALDDINKDEVIAMFDGDIYDKDFDGWTDEILDHVIQFAPLKWRDSKGIARRLNHSCEPNCGIKDLFKIVAMRDIKKGEELTWDYEMTEKNEFGWRMKCRCGTESCRKSIGNFKNMPEEVRKKYEGYISEWLVS